jgi:hypothetical protein
MQMRNKSPWMRKEGKKKVLHMNRKSNQCEQREASYM